MVENISLNDPWKQYVTEHVVALEQLILNTYTWHKYMNFTDIGIEHRCTIAMYHSSIRFVNSAWEMLRHLAEQYGGLEETAMIERLDYLLPLWEEVEDAFIARIGFWALTSS